MKERLDVLLVKRNLAESREKAKAVIMAGNVFVEGQREDKAGTTFPDTVQIEVRGHVLPYVSRGGLKLERRLPTLTSVWMEKSVQMWVHPPADLRIVCFKTAPERYLRSMWEEDSWTGNSDRMSGLCVWRRPISVM